MARLDEAVMSVLAGSAVVAPRESPHAVPARAAMVLGGTAATLLLGLPGLLLTAAGGTAMWGVRRRRSAQASQARLRELNDLVPLLQLAVGAGLTVRSTLAAVTPWSAGRLGAQLGELLERVEQGASLADGLDALPEALGETCRGLASVLGAAERYGSPLVDPLARLGAELRLQRRRQLEQAARRVPVQLLFPLALGVLPAFVLLAVVPLAATALDGVVLPGR